MAKIIRSDSQIEALKAINEGIRRVQKIDSMLSKQGNCSVSIKSGDSRLAVSEDAFARQVLGSLKRETLRTIKASSAKFNIELTQEEQRILGFDIKEQNRAFDMKEQEAELPEEQEAELPTTNLEEDFIL